MDNNNVQNRQEKKRQKQIFGVFLIIIIIAFAFGLFQFFYQLKNPFKRPEIANTEKQNLSAADALLALQNLRARDVDEDGLSDYDELYVYQTSPYLDDSDSDGIKDKEEIEKETDPNCPEGKDCTQPSIANTAGQTTGLAVEEQLSLSPENIPIDTLRQTLKNSGVPESTLNAIDDQTLRDMYAQVLAEEGIDTNIAVNTANAETSPTNANTGSINVNETNIQNISMEDLQNMDASQIRDFLSQFDIDKATLDQVDDESLMSIFQEALKEQGY